jgi:hypothetical protein
MGRLVMVCASAVIATVCGMTSAQAATVTMDIKFKKNPSTVGVKCLAQMNGGDKRKHVDRGDTIHWNLVPGNCPDFDAKNVEIVFETKVMKNGMTLKGKDNAVEDSVTSVETDAPELSPHIYIIKYAGMNAGDPELDINPNAVKKGAAKKPAAAAAKKPKP